MILQNLASYLLAFGYREENPNSPQLLSPDTLKKQIKSLQRYAGIPETGVLDKDTIEMMETPRCGLPDLEATDRNYELKTRKKRFVTHSTKWSNKVGFSH